ncbi:unnamed protein product, partial [Iphiclides podalirius]
MSTVAKRNASAPLAVKSRNYGAGALRQSREATLFGGRRQVKTRHGTVLRFINTRGRVSCRMAVSYPGMSTVAKRNASAPLAVKSRNYGAGALRQSREATLFGGRRQVKTRHGTVLRFVSVTILC